MSGRPRRWRGFAALEREGGAIIWGSFRATEDAARTAFERHNPMRPVVIVPVEIRTTGDAEPLPPFEADA